MVRGYEAGKDTFVEVSDEELERLAPEKSRDIDLRRFVNADDIPPIYFERGYFLAPAAGSTKAYQLLATIMEKTHRAGIATFVMRGKEYLIAIVAEHGILRAETMRFKDEIRTPRDIGLPDKPKVPLDLVKRFARIINKDSAEELSRDELHDEAAAALLSLVKAKQKQKKDVVISKEAEGEEPSAPPDLLTVLKQSLAGHGRGPRHQRVPGAIRGHRQNSPRHQKAPQRTGRRQPRAAPA